MSKARDISKSTETLDVDGGTIKLDGNYPVGTNNVALGDAALDSIQASGTRNTAIGFSAGTALTTQGYNVFVGSYSGDGATGSSNVAVGDVTLRNTSGSFNTAIGGEALQNNTTASNNTAVGYQAGYNSTTATGLALFGKGAGYSNTTGSSNTVHGLDALYYNTTGSYNTAVGRDALVSNTTGSDNTAVGIQAGFSNQTGGENTFVGKWAGYSSNASSANAGNICVGARSGYYLTTGIANTFVGSNNPTGYGAGFFVTTGSKNTILGCFSGNQHGLDIRTSSNNIVLSDGDGNPRLWGDASGHFMIGGTYKMGTTVLNINGVNSSTNGIGFKNTADTGTIYNLFVFNSANSLIGSITNNGSSTSFNTSSDYRLKENVVELTGATDRLKQIPVHRFNFTADPDTTVDGFLAHEVQAVVPEAITGTKDEVDADGNPVYQGIDQSKLVPLLVATIKELEARITALEAK